MIRKEFTGVMNLIILIIGLLLSVGVGPNHPFMFIVFGLFATLILIYRGKLYGIPLVALAISTYLFFNNYMFSVGNLMGYETPSILWTILKVFNIVCFFIYAIYNAYILNKNNLKNRKG